MTQPDGFISERPWHHNRHSRCVVHALFAMSCCHSWLRRRLKTKSKWIEYLARTALLPLSYALLCKGRESTSRWFSPRMLRTTECAGGALDGHVYSNCTYERSGHCACWCTSPYWARGWVHGEVPSTTSIGSPMVRLCNNPFVAMGIDVIIHAKRSRFTCWAK